MSDSWSIKYDSNIVFNLKPMGFKHTGLFPEQATNWDWFIERINERKSKGKDTKVLNLFAYTGGATLACLSKGASVCHVDSSQGMVNWAKENVKSSKMQDASVRFIVDDVQKFVKREIRRGNKYDLIIMDPPSYGRGKNGEVWDIEKDLYSLLCDSANLLTDEHLGIVINTYTGGLSSKIIEKALKEALNEKNYDNIYSINIGLKEKDSLDVLPCGITTRYEKR